MSDLKKVYIVKTIENYIIDEELKSSKINTYTFKNRSYALAYAHKISNIWFYKNTNDYDDKYDKCGIEINSTGSYEHELEFHIDGLRYECSVTEKIIEYGQLMFSDKTELLIHGC